MKVMSAYYTKSRKISGKVRREKITYVPTTHYCLVSCLVFCVYLFK